MAGKGWVDHWLGKVFKNDLVGIKTFNDRVTFKDRTGISHRSYKNCLTPLGANMNREMYLMAKMLLDKGHPIEEVYHITRKSMLAVQKGYNCCRRLKKRDKMRMMTRPGSRKRRQLQLANEPTNVRPCTRALASMRPPATPMMRPEENQYETEDEEYN
ncbi:hypothetical protein VYU27_010579 [Nannochloropsis oceanica]